VFALEEVVGDLQAPMLGPVVLASATSWLVLRVLLGNNPLFKVPQYRSINGCIPRNAFELFLFFLLFCCSGACCLRAVNAIKNAFYAFACHLSLCMYLKVRFLVDSIPSALTILFNDLHSES